MNHLSQESKGHSHPTISTLLDCHMFLQGVLITRIVYVARMVQRHNSVESIRRESRDTQHYAADKLTGLLGSSTCLQQLITRRCDLLTLVPVQHLSTVQLSRAIDKHSQDGEITGFLLVYPVCYIHVIEVIHLRAKVCSSV